jgi:formyl-CoA transferase
VRQLARDADIVIERPRPGTLENGASVTTRVRNQSGLILLRLWASANGPHRDQPAFGAGESMGGMRHVTSLDRPPLRMDISIGDAQRRCGVIGVLVALSPRTGGNGQVVDASVPSRIQHDGKPDPTITTSPAGGAASAGLANIVPSNTYTTRDGRSIVIAGNGDSIYKRLMHAIGRDDQPDRSAATSAVKARRRSTARSATGRGARPRAVLAAEGCRRSAW